LTRHRHPDETPREASLLKSSIIAGVSMLALASAAFAADPAPRPMFTRGGPNWHANVPGKPALGGLATFTLKWTYSGKSYSALFVGTEPQTGTSTTIPVYIVPMKLTVGTTTEDPTAPDFTGVSPVNNIIASPIFQTLDYKQGKTDVGTTQYEDAFQRANLWGKVKKHTGYHVLLGTPTVEPVQAYTVPKGDGTVTTDFGVQVLNVSLGWFDTQVNSLLKSLSIPANSLPLFIVNQTYLTSGGCCIGGYHNYTGTQAYSVSTYISNSGKNIVFSQDVSALSHELGEFYDDPLVNNSNIPSLCSTQGNHNSIYEVGDPIEVDANYGDYEYTLGGLVWHLQDLVMPTYFGAKKNTSIPFNQTFQGTKFSVCQNGG
jgi:hypothetical protein